MKDAKQANMCILSIESLTELWKSMKFHLYWMINMYTASENMVKNVPNYYSSHRLQLQSRNMSDRGLF